jgi:hypothetical protein
VNITRDKVFLLLFERKGTLFSHIHGREKFLVDTYSRYV